MSVCSAVCRMMARCRDEAKTPDSHLGNYVDAEVRRGDSVEYDRQRVEEKKKVHWTGSEQRHADLASGEEGWTEENGAFSHDPPAPSRGHRLLSRVIGMVQLQDINHLVCRVCMW